MLGVALVGRRDRSATVVRVVPIAPMVQSFLDNVTLTGLAEENLQARVRGMTLMGLSNQSFSPRSIHPRSARWPPMP